MKQVFVMSEFFRRYWPEVQHCVSLTVELWGELIKLALELARELCETQE
jgi:hypothetical protein